MTKLRAQAQDVTSEETIGAVRIVENTEDNRLQLFFPGNPPPRSAASSSGPVSGGRAPGRVATPPLQHGDLLGPRAAEKYHARRPPMGTPKAFRPSSRAAIRPAGRGRGPSGSRSDAPVPEENRSARALHPSIGEAHRRPVNGWS